MSAPPEFHKVKKELNKNKERIYNDSGREYLKCGCLIAFSEDRLATIKYCDTHKLRTTK